MERAKILVNKREIQADEVVWNLKNHADYLNRSIAPKMNNLGIDITHEILHDMLTNDCQNIQEIYIKRAERELLEIQDRTLREGYMCVIREAVRKLIVDITKIKHMDKEEFLSVQNGEIVLTAEGEMAVRESFYHYLTDPEEIQKYEQLQAVCDALNVFYSGKPFGLWNDFFGLEDSKFIPKNTLNYSEVVRNTSGNKKEK